jgi:hypothetical protein
MPATINNNILELQPDNIGYQAFRIPLSAVSNASTMVFYYKAYVDNTPNNINEDSGSYGWNNDAFFGLSFNGVLSANIGGIVGWTNSTNNTVVFTQSLANYSPLNNFSGYSQFVPVCFDTSTNVVSYGHPTITTRASLPSNAGYFCPSTTTIGVSGAQRFLGILKVAKHPTNTQQIIISYGTNWENMPASSFSSALSSLSTNWLTYGSAQTETTNFRPNNANPLLSDTINFPTWIVGKWPSTVSGRELVISDMKVEYYNSVF